MAQPTPTADPTYRYLVTVGPRDGSVRFNSVSGLELSLAIEYKDRNGDWCQHPEQAMQVTLRRGEPGGVEGVWARWAEDTPINFGDTNDITVSLLGKSDNSLVTWSLAGATFIKSSGSDRDGDGIYEFEELRLLVVHPTVTFH